MTKIKNRILAALMALVLVLSLTPEALAASDVAATATTAQLAQKEGAVTVSNSAGKKLSLIEKMRLYNGYHVKTDEKSYAWINLDDAKLGKLDAVSEVELRKSGKKLELLLNEGNIFFNISEPLKDDESLNIRTSSMSIGIRGTSGWAEVMDEQTAEIYTLEGTVEVTVTDAVTGKTKSDTVSGGEKLTCRVSPSGSEPTATSSKYKVEDISGFVLMELKDDMSLRQKITQESGLDLVHWTANPEQRLKADQDEVHQKLERIKTQEDRQPNNISEYTPAAAPAPSASSGGVIKDGKITWTYDAATKTLRIALTETKVLTRLSFGWEDIMWNAYEDEIENVILEEGIWLVDLGTFRDIKNLRNISIPSTIGSVRTSFFVEFESPNLTDVYFNGTQAMWNEIATAPYGYYYSQDLTIHCTDGDILFLAGLYFDGTLAEWNEQHSGNLYNFQTDFVTVRCLDGDIIVQTASAVPSSGYSDVPANAWYAEAVAYCRKNNLMSGTSDTKFSPDEPLTRAMIVTVLHRLAGSPAAAGKASLSDVKSGKWYTEAISWANSKGIVQGYPNGSFGINDPVTHGQVALIFQRYSGDSNLRTIGAETPKTPATRAEIAATLMDYAEGRIESLAAGELSTYSAMDEMCAPSGIALDDDGSLLVTDRYNKQVWHVTNRYSANCAGGTTVKDLYGQPVGGYNDASANASYFKAPWAVAPYQDSWAVTDAENNAVRLILKDGVKTIPTNGALDHPTGLASDGEGNLYISDTFNGIIHKLTPKGELSTAASGLTEPMGLCWKDGVLYIAETGANRIVKLQNGQVTTVASSGLECPQGVAVADDGTIYVADTCSSAIRQIKNGTVSTLYARDISKNEADLISPTALLLQGDRLLICDSFSRKIFSMWLK